MFSSGPAFPEQDIAFTIDKLPAGKSTLLKLMVGQLEPVDGMVKRHNHLRIGQYHQHLTELLPMDITPLQYMVR